MEEFTRVWAKLEKTYDNKYQQAYSHIMQILNIPHMSKPSAEKLRAMIDTTDQHLRMLKRFDVDTEQWSAIICVILLGKIDNETRGLWETKDNLPNIPDMNALFSHLEQRILAIRNMEQSARQYALVSQPAIANDKPAKASPRQPQHDSKNGVNRKPASKAEPMPPSKPCPMCANGVEHFLWRCDAFRALDSAKKLDLLKSWNICEVCLVANHAAADCSKGICPNCHKGKHNTAVCPQPKARQINHIRGGKRKRGQQPT